MRISLNGMDLPKSAEGDLTISEVLNELSREIYESGKLLIRVVLDGTPIPENWQRDSRLNRPVSTARKLDLIVDLPQRVAAQMLNDGARMLEKLNQNASSLAQKFRIGDDVLANNELAEFLKELNLVMTGLELSMRHGGDKEGASQTRGKLEEAAGELIPALDRIYKAQAAGDHIAIADEIQYELPEQMTRWQQLIGESARMLDKSCTTA